MSLSTKSSRHAELLRQLQELENENLGDVEDPPKSDAANTASPPVQSDCIDAAVQAPKKPRTAKQLESFEKAKAIRDANYAKRKQEADQLAAAERKQIEEKLVKKAIALKKKQIKQQKILDDIPSEDDEENQGFPSKPILSVQKSKDIKPPTVSQPVKITPKFSFF